MRRKSNGYYTTQLCEIEFPAHNNEKEGDYNKRFAQSIDPYMNMDCKVVSPRSDRSTIELCDTLTDKKELIHIKRGESSALLSHLFNQGLVSAELIKGDSQFCKKANAKITEMFKEQHLKGRLQDYLLESGDKLTIVYAIIKSGDEKHPPIPLFGKIAFSNVKKQLGLMGCQVKIKHIKSLN